MPKRPEIDTISTPVPAPDQTSDTSVLPTSVWTTPVLRVYGDVRELTMGGSPGINESGFGGVRKP